MRHCRSLDFLFEKTICGSSSNFGSGCSSKSIAFISSRRRKMTAAPHCSETAVGEMIPSLWNRRPGSLWFDVDEDSRLVVR